MSTPNGSSSSFDFNNALKFLLNNFFPNGIEVYLDGQVIVNLMKRFYDEDVSSYPKRHKFHSWVDLLKSSQLKNHIKCKVYKGQQTTKIGSLVIYGEKFKQSETSLIRKCLDMMDITHVASMKLDRNSDNRTGYNSEHCVKVGESHAMVTSSSSSQGNKVQDVALRTMMTPPPPPMPFENFMSPTTETYNSEEDNGGVLPCTPTYTPPEDDVNCWMTAVTHDTPQFEYEGHIETIEQEKEETVVNDKGRIVKSLEKQTTTDSKDAHNFKYRTKWSKGRTHLSPNHERTNKTPTVHVEKTPDLNSQNGRWFTPKTAHERGDRRPQIAAYENQNIGQGRIESYTRRYNQYNVNYKIKHSRTMWRDDKSEEYRGHSATQRYPKRDANRREEKDEKNSYRSKRQNEERSDGKCRSPGPRVGGRHY